MWRGSKQKHKRNANIDQILLLQIKNALLKNVFYLISDVNLSCFQTYKKLGDNIFGQKSKQQQQDSYIKFCIFIVIMEEFSRIDKEPSSFSAEITIDADRIKFFNTKVKIWEYTKISTSGFQKLSFDERASILKNYYSDISVKYSVGAGILFICFFIL